MSCLGLEMKMERDFKTDGYFKIHMIVEKEVMSYLWEPLWKLRSSQERIWIV